MSLPLCNLFSHRVRICRGLVACHRKVCAFRSISSMEVRPEHGIMPSREQFGVVGGLQKNPVQPQPSMQSMRLSFAPDGTAIYASLASTSPTYRRAGGEAAPGDTGESAAPKVAPLGISMHMGEPGKRKRGRPRKYGTEGAMVLALNPTSASPVVAAGLAGFSSPAAGNTPDTAPSALLSAAAKKHRGRPPGSGKKRQTAARGSAGMGFTPHVITVKAGEDVYSKITSFSHHGPHAVCVLSANGAVSDVTLRQPAMSGGTVTKEGQFEILSLSGSFLPSESGGQRSQTGGLSVSLAGPDGRVLGGVVAGLLTAASPVQVIVGSFLAKGPTESSSNQMNPSEPSSAPTKLTPAVTMGTGSPPSRGTLSESSGGPGSPLNQSSGAFNNANRQEMPRMPWKINSL